MFLCSEVFDVFVFVDYTLMQLYEQMFVTNMRITQNMKITQNEIKYIKRESVENEELLKENTQKQKAIERELTKF